LLCQQEMERDHREWVPEQEEAPDTAPDSTLRALPIRWYEVEDLQPGVIEPDEQVIIQLPGRVPPFRTEDMVFLTAVAECEDDGGNTIHF